MLNKRTSLFKVVLYVVALAIAPIVIADPAPVVDVTQNTTSAVQTEPAIVPATANDITASSTAISTQSLTVEQRLERLEQQMANIIRMNLPQQITDMQQNMQQLQGELQVQAHDLKLLNDQQRNFYQDLDQRITQLKNLVSGGNEGSSSNTPSDKPDSSTNATSIQMKDANAYKTAFDLLTQRKYDEAKAAFQDYLNEFPNGQFLVNAHYWLGEIHLSQQNIQQAAQEFSTVVKKFPKSNKAPDAKLKLGIIHMQMGKVAKARQEFLTVKKQYPNTTAAQLATIQLQQLQANQKGDVNSSTRSTSDMP